jgi:hypothetical protein
MSIGVDMPSGTNDNGSRKPADSVWGLRASGNAFWWLERLFALIAALLLTASAFGHLGNNYYFLSTIYSYQLVSVELGYWIAVVLPLLQMIIAILLFIRRDMYIVFMFSCLIFTIFLYVQWSAWRRGLDIPCGCFGTMQMKIGMTSMSLAIIGFFSCTLGLIFYHISKTYGVNNYEA